ncbi:hypothetical protein [Streptomyces sp. NPDC015345]|uniref:hypothetical protein n=1 Tax=Streptomyces sp. NPDC015345 TaxID=3364953 RepID=UPI0036FAC1C4
MDVRAIRKSIAAITALPPATLRFLTERVDRLEAELDEVLCDWDTVAHGHPEWDLVTIEVHCRRFGYTPQHYKDFATAYGYDVTTLAGCPTLRDLRELRAHARCILPRFSPQAQNGRSALFADANRSQRIRADFYSQSRFLKTTYRLEHTTAISRIAKG